MADRLKPRPASQYDLFKKNLQANSIDQGGAPDIPVGTPPENRPNPSWKHMSLIRAKMVSIK